MNHETHFFRSYLQPIGKVPDLVPNQGCHMHETKTPMPRASEREEGKRGRGGFKLLLLVRLEVGGMALLACMMGRIFEFTL